MKIVMTFLVALLAATSTLAQASAPAPTSSEQVSVSYVMVPFTALGKKGNPRTDIRERDVKLFIDGVRVRPDMFERSMNSPVSFTILVDASGSMALAGKMDAARAAIATLLARRIPGDEFALYVFAESDAHEVVPFTKDPMPIFRALDKIKPYGKTAFFDALAKMPDRSELGTNGSRAIILLSDGIDNASSLHREALAKSLEGIAVPIYPLGIREAAEAPKKHVDEGTNLDVLAEVARLTGGQLHVGNTPQLLAAAVESLEDDLRAQYLIGFSPTGKGAVKYRRISLQIAGDVRTIRVRGGYRGTEPPLLDASASVKGQAMKGKK
jgi:VWFA-related protein